jgi:hypothetical protein
LALVLGLPPADFEAWRPELERRGFPIPESTTGRYCAEAAEGWRLRRHRKLFPELTGGQPSTLNLFSKNDCGALGESR